jgi:hypothetical protein
MYQKNAMVMNKCVVHERILSLDRGLSFWCWVYKLLLLLLFWFTQHFVRLVHYRKGGFYHKMAAFSSSCQESFTVTPMSGIVLRAQNTA